MKFQACTIPSLQRCHIRDAAGTRPQLVLCKSAAVSMNYKGALDCALLCNRCIAEYKRLGGVVPLTAESLGVEEIY